MYIIIAILANIFAGVLVQIFRGCRVFLVYKCRLCLCSFLLIYQVKWIAGCNDTFLLFFLSTNFSHLKFIFKDLCFTLCSHRKKRMRQITKKIKSGRIDVNEDDTFELFIAATNIRYCYYAETHKILGNTYGMCILQVMSPTVLFRPGWLT